MTPAQVALVESHRANVHALAVRLLPTLPRVELDDAIADGYVGLVQAALAFDPNRGVPFHAYAAIIVRGAIIDGTRRYVRRLKVPVSPAPLTPSVARSLRADTACPEAIAIAESNQRFLARAIAACPNPVTRDVARGVQCGESIDGLSRRLGISRAWVHELRQDFLQAARHALEARPS